MKLSPAKCSPCRKNFCRGKDERGDTFGESLSPPEKYYWGVDGGATCREHKQKRLRETSVLYDVNRPVVERIFIPLCVVDAPYPALVYKGWEANLLP